MSVYSGKQSNGKFGRPNTGTARIHKEAKRDAAKARQQRHLDRGYLIDENGQRYAPAPLTEF